jgi:hypothetical protein
MTEMSKTNVLLIGFAYTNINNLNPDSERNPDPLPGMIFDLYHAYKWCKQRHYTIKIFTDLQSIQYNHSFRTALRESIVGKDIKIICEEIMSNRTLITDGQSFQSHITNYIKHIHGKIIIYYSGHGITQNMVMPNQDLVPFLSFRDIILNNKSLTDLFFILDCCNPVGLNLPFNLKDNRFYLSSDQVDFVKPSILLITSAESTELSVATDTGSLFSRQLFYWLTRLAASDPPIIDRREKTVTLPIHKNRNLTLLMSNLNKLMKRNALIYPQDSVRQQVAIYSSYVIEPMLWSWIISDKTITMDERHNYLIIS